MKPLITSILKYTIDKVKRNRFIQNVFESPFDLDKFDKTGIFEDSNGNKHQLYQGLRSKIRPGWERMLANKSKKATEVNIQKLKTNSYIYFDKLETSLNTINKSIVNSRVLEIGCHAGATCFAMAEKGAKEVIGTEFNGYKLSATSSTSHDNEEKLNEVSEYLKSLRDRLKSIYPVKDNIKFVDDDICNSKLEENSFDIICSWEVLEHLNDPLKAFSNITKLLKPGGISIHQYNQFFASMEVIVFAP